MIESDKMNYSYDAAQIHDGDLNQMRFELGDVLVFNPNERYLSDEEICAVLSLETSWRRKKLKLVEALLMRFSYEVTQEVRDAKWQLSDRVKFWEELRKRLSAEVADEGICAALGMSKNKMRPPIFKIGMHDGVKLC